MTTHTIGTRDEWLKARLELLAEEKAHTRRGDELAQRRRELPWVRVDKDYRFATDDGDKTLAEMFGGRSQMLVYHFMFGPDYTAGCPACSAIADGFNGFVSHLMHHDVAFWAISRGQLPKLQAYKKRMGWTFPWASSFGSDFNFDFGVGMTKEQQESGPAYNFTTEPGRPANTPGSDEEALGTGADWATYVRERPGISAFALEDGVVYHTYSGYARSLDALWGMYQWLDRAPLGRNENHGGDIWWRRNDEYDD
jgi:predicted dithiol-disulfide oxidoreductase (DUF899 family)